MLAVAVVEVIQLGPQAVLAVAEQAQAVQTEMVLLDQPILVVVAVEPLETVRVAQAALAS
jgi:hypothetical protein